MGCTFSSRRHLEEEQGNSTQRPPNLTISNQTLTIRSPILGPNVPTEIHLAIAEHLSPSAVAALALSCKRFFNVFSLFIGPSSVFGDERSEFLFLLERDLPDYYYRIPSDWRLKKRDTTSTPQTYSSRLHGSECAYKVLASRFNYTITLSHFALALKRDTCGGEHGLGLDSFNYCASRTVEPLEQTHDGSVRVDLSVTPKIVAARLLLRCDYHIHRVAGAKQIQMHELSSFNLPLCRHVHTQHHRFPWYCQSLSNALRPRRYTDEDDDSDDSFSTFDSKPLDTLRGRCSFCMTDWAVATSASGDGVNVTTWQNFGHRAGADLVWKALVAGGYAEHYCRVVKFPAGCVKEAFETGDGSRLESLDMRI